MGLLERIGLRKGREALRVGVIGPGLIWRKKHRIELEPFADRVEVAAMCARSAETLDAAELPRARRYAGIETLLADDELEAVLILTPIALNAPTAVAALRAGKDVFVEKPLGRSVAECREVLAAEKESGRRVFVLEQSVYRADIAAAKRLLDEGRIGELVLFDRVDHMLFDAGAHDLGGFGKVAWRREADFPLGAMFDAGVHAIAQLNRLFGLPQSVLASGKKWREEFGDQDEVLAQLEYASGLRGVFSQSSALPNVHTGFNIRGTGGVLRPTGTGVVLTDLEGHSEELEAAGNDMWARTLEGRGYSALEAARDVAVLEAIARSIESEAREAVEPVA
jgi:scyllo-inositol 2-dehydrogenase (NADP+)